MIQPPLADPANDFRALWEDYAPTRLIELPALAQHIRVGRVFMKAEYERPLGNFKVSGGMIAGLRALARALGLATPHDLRSHSVPPESLPTLICASDGNHGLAVAAAAARSGTRAAIYLPFSASPIRAQRIEAMGGEVRCVSGTYDDAVDAAQSAAARGDGILIPDTSADPNDAVVKDVMAGYGLITQELVTQFRDEMRDAPTHVFVQAGVGGLAAAVAEGLRDFMAKPRRVLVVEPDSAACVAHALLAGRPERISGSLHTSAEMLSCGLASAPAVEILKRHDARSVPVNEDQLGEAVRVLRDLHSLRTTPSGAAGLAGLLHVSARSDLWDEHQLGAESKVLFLVTEGPLALASPLPAQQSS
jgi:diaminopropionate ammonia-lyase